MIHIFDVDHTVYRGSTVQDFLIRGMLERRLPASLFLSLPIVTLSFIINRGFIREGRENPFLKGIPRERMHSLASDIFEDKIKDRINPEILKIIRSIQDINEKVILATSSFRVIVEPLASFLNIDQLIATELEYIKGSTTGRLNGTPAFGQGKKEKMEILFKNEGIEPENCSFYTDSYRDLPLMGIVGLPVAVNPDRKLMKTALERKWKVIR